MKEETKRKWKKYLKIILPIVIIIALVVYKVVTMKLGGVPKTVDVDGVDLSKQFAQAMSEHSMLMLDGHGDEADYEWFYGENTITSDDETDLKVYYTHEYDTFVKESLHAQEVLGFYFADNINLNGYPTLTLTLHNWSSQNVSLYKVNKKAVTKAETQPVVNVDDDGNVVVTYQVVETDGIYYLAGGIHNYNLQGQGTSEAKPSVSSKRKDKANTKKEVKEDSKTGSQSPQTDNSVSGNTGKNGNTGSSGNQTGDEKKTHSSKLSNYVSDVKPSGKESKLATALKRILSDGKGTGQDQYLTDPVPEGKPMPVEPDKVTVNYKKSYTCTISIDCKSILSYKGDITEGKEDYIPTDGWILKETKVLFYEGESVFDVLLRETQKRKIQMEYTMTPIYNSNYIEGIQNLYEFDCGSLSGWTYQVNGWYPNYGCSRYMLEEGDVIKWRYTCDLGRDVGCEWIAKS